MSSLSVVIPAYNEGDLVVSIANVVQDILNGADIRHEMIFVDDGSGDSTWEHIENLSKRNDCIKGIKLSRNFGKDSAILAGLIHATGDACAVIDCDLQHPPELLVQMHQLWMQGGVDIVDCIKQSRGQEKFVYKCFANVFYGLIARIGGVNLKSSSDFKLLDRRIVDIIISMPERQRFFRAQTTWTGFNRVEIFFSVAQRARGTSKFNFYKSAKYALVNIASFSSAPMQVVTVLGFAFLLIAFVFGFHTFYYWLMHRAVEGFTTVILLLLIIGSVIMISLGIIGFYVGRIYEEIKGRPPFLIESITTCRKDEE